MRVLLVEDDVLLGKATQKALIQQTFVVDLVGTIKDAKSYILSYEYDILLLDLGLPDETGESFIGFLRKQKSLIPIIVLTAKDEINERIEALEKGADDFIVKPYDIAEVVARIRAVLRRTSGRADNIMHYGDLEVNITSRSVSLKGNEILLTGREFYILTLLLDRKGAVLTRQQLEDSLYQYGDEVNSNTVEVHIHHLRKKLGKGLIRTVYATGYTIDRE